MAIITISMGTMSGGEALAKAVGDRLEHAVIGRELIVHAAERSGISQAELTQKVDQPPGWWDRMTANRRRYVAAIQTALVEHALEGRLVYHGFLGHLLLEEVPQVLRVRVITPLGRRVSAVMKREQLSRAQAERYVRQVDDDRSRWLKFVYGVDWHDPALYDVVVNLERTSIEGARDALCSLARRPEHAIDEAAAKAMADVFLACRVKLALATSSATASLDCLVRADDGRVELTCTLPPSGLLLTAREHIETQIRKTVGELPGVRSVRLSLPPPIVGD